MKEYEPENELMAVLLISAGIKTRTQMTVLLLLHTCLVKEAAVSPQCKRVIPSFSCCGKTILVCLPYLLVWAQHHVLFLSTV